MLSISMKLGPGLWQCCIEIVCALAYHQDLSCHQACHSALQYRLDDEGELSVWGKKGTFEL